MRHLRKKKRQRLKKHPSSCVFFLFVCFTEWLKKHSRSHTRTPSQRLRQESSSLVSLSPSVTPASSLPAHLLQLPPPSLSPSTPVCSLHQTKCKHPLYLPAQLTIFRHFPEPLTPFVKTNVSRGSSELSVSTQKHFRWFAVLEKDKSIGESRIHLKHQMPWLMNNANEAFSAGSLFKALTAAYSHSFLFIPIFLHRSMFALLWVLRGV